MPVGLMPTILEVTVWVNNRSNTMFLVTCKRVNLSKIQHTHTLIHIYESTVFRIYIMSPGVEPPEYDRRIRGVVSKSPRDSIVVGL
jgi:hypothetical protein